MNYSRIIKRGILLLSLGLSVFAACNKTPTNSLPDVDDNGGYASDASKLEWLSNDAISLADIAGQYYNGVHMKMTDTLNTFGACAVVSTDTISSTEHTLVIRFGNQNCRCLDGRYRRGTILVNYSGQYMSSGCIHNISFQNYFVNDEEVQGSIVATKIDTTIIGDWYYKVLSNLSLVTTPNQIATWKGTLVRKWLTGYKTGDRNDDAFSISGSSTLTRSNSHTFVFDIQTPMQISTGCDYCSFGLVKVTGYTGTRLLDYGFNFNNEIKAECDNAARLNIDGHLYTLHLQ